MGRVVQKPGEVHPSIHQRNRQILQRFALHVLIIAQPILLVHGPITKIGKCVAHIVVLLARTAHAAEFILVAHVVMNLELCLDQSTIGSERRGCVNKKGPNTKNTILISERKEQNTSPQRLAERAH